MSFGAAALAVTAAQGVTSISQGYARSAEDKYNASLYDRQAELYKVQGDITQGQYIRQAGKILSRQTAVAGAAGIQPTGSLAAAMVDTQTQINTDAAIARFNTQMNINQSKNSSEYVRRKAEQEIYSGYTSAFTDALTGASNYAMYKYGPAKLNLS